MKLGEIKPGQKVRIISYNNSRLALRLMEMGCLPGEEVQLVNTAPMGDPITILLDTGMIALRLENANEIEVELCS